MSALPSPPPSPTTTEGANPTLYTRATMALRYTPQVIWWRHPHVWGVPNRLLHARYAVLTGARHVEIGPGNGYFLKRLPPWSRLEHLHLIDVNFACLALTTRAVRGRFFLSPHCGSAVEPWGPIPDSRVDSVGCQMAMHAIHRDRMADLAPLVAEAHRVLKPGGVFFGATIVPRGAGIQVGRVARRLIDRYTATGVFFNRDDSLEELHGLLGDCFGADYVTVRPFGCVAVWEASKR